MPPFVLITAAGGRLLTSYREEVEALQPIAEPLALTGKLPMCAVTPGCEREATTVALAFPNNRAWCGTCGAA